MHLRHARLGVHAIARDAADMIIATDDGEITEVDGTLIKVAYKSQGKVTYKLNKFERSNQDTCINQRPIVVTGQQITAGDILANGRDQVIPSTTPEWTSPEHAHGRGPGYYQ